MMAFWSKKFCLTWLHTLQESLNVALHNTHCDGTSVHHSVSVFLNRGLWPRDKFRIWYPRLVHYFHTMNVGRQEADQVMTLDWIAY